MLFEVHCSTFETMKKNDRVSYRLSDETKARLDALSESTGVPTAQLARQALDEYLDKIEREGVVTFKLKPKTTKSKTSS